MSYAGGAKVADTLLEAGADVNHPDIEGTTALHVAAENGDLDAIDTLIRRGANCVAENTHGNIPLDIARTLSDDMTSPYEQPAASGGDGIGVIEEQSATPWKQRVVNALLQMDMA